MPDFPSAIYVREPAVEGWTEIEAALFNDYRDEIEALEATLGAGTGGQTPKGGFTSLAARIDGFVSEGGRQRRKVSTYLSSDGATVTGLKGNVRNDIQVEAARAETSLGNNIWQGAILQFDGPGPHTVHYFAFYDTFAGPKIPDQIIVQIHFPAGNTVRALQAFVDTASLTFDTFQVYVRQLVPGGMANPPTGAGNKYIIHYMAIGGLLP